MAPNIISLRISGTKVRKAGFAPLVAIGIIPPAEEHNLDRSLQVSERPGFILKQTGEYVIYNAVDCRVRPVDDDAPGRMSVAISIPAGMQLADGASPYRLLMEIYSFFRRNYMSPLTDGRDVFTNGEVDSEPFRAILGRYSLEERKGRYIAMSPSGMSGRLQLAESKMEDFFRDSQYPELAAFKEIEIGTTGESSPSLDSIQVPRPKAYKLKINGIERATVSSISEPLPVRAMSTETETFTPVTFTIGELLDNGGLLERNGAVIRLNPATETISCDLERKPITYRVHVNWAVNKDAAQVMRQWMENGDISIVQNGKDYTAELLGGKCRIGVRNVRDEFRASKNSFKGNIIRITQNVDRDKQEIVLTFSVMQERRTVIVPDDRRQGGNAGDGIRMGGAGKRVGDNNRIGGNEIINQQIASDHVMRNDVTANAEPERSSGAGTQKAFFFGILLGFILGLAAFYALNEFLLKDKQAETDKNVQSEQIAEAGEVKDALPVEKSVEEDPAPTAEQGTGVDAGAGKNIPATETTPVTTPEQANRTPNEEPIKVKPDVPTIDDLKAQLLKYYNNNQWRKCQEVMNGSKELKKTYKKDMEWIIKIRQNKAFDKDGFKNPELTEDQILNLQATGYISGDMKPTGKFNVGSLDDIAPLKRSVEGALNAF